MKVFNLYLKLFKAYSIVVIVYVGIFLAVGIMLSSSQEASSDAFTEVRVNVTLNNLNQESVVTEGLVEYLSKFVDYKEVEKEEVEDALFFRQIHSYITIPENFENDFLAGKDGLIIQQRIEENATTIALDRAINKYLKYVRVYGNQTDKTLEEVVSSVKLILDNEAEVIKTEEESDQLTSSGFYYKSVSYILNAVILTVVGLITIAFRKFDVRRRLIVSPYPVRKANRDMLLGNLIFTIALVALIGGVSFIMFPKSMPSFNGILLLINTFVFSLAALSMSYFMSLLIKNEEVLSGVNNVYSLGSAFLTGTFVPQALLSQGVLAFAHILPNYYFIYNVDLITSTTHLSTANMNRYILFLVIQFLFACLFVVFTIFLSKKQARSEE